MHVRFGDSLNLLGYSIWPPLPWIGGTAARPVVAWQAEKTISERYYFVIQMVDLQGHVWAKQTTEPNDGATPTTEWLTGKTIGDQYSLNLPSAMPTGDYQIVIEVHKSNGDYIEAHDSKGLSLGTGAVLETIQVEKSHQSVNADQLEMGQRLYVDMRELRFLGYEIGDRRPGAGDLVQLGIYWRARAKPRGDYVVAVQLRDSSGHTVFEQANRPAHGTYPTTEWEMGEVLLDWHDFELPSTIQSGEYTLRVSLLDLSSNATLGDAELGALTVQ